MPKLKRQTPENRKLTLLTKSNSIILSIISILSGILIGFIIMLIVGVCTNGAKGIGDSFYALAIIFMGPFNGLNISKEIGNMLFYSVPLIFTGLSLGLAYKTGLFNIGAPGQFYMGSMGALLIGLGLELNWGIAVSSSFGHFAIWLLAVICGTVLGALWGIIPGLLKALFGINEVIVCIMTNWIAANLVSWVFNDMPNLISKDHGAFLKYISTTGNSTPTLGLDKLTNGSMLDIGIFIAIFFCIIIYIIMNKTTFGFELKASGLNANGAKYAGINEKKCMVISMIIAGGLAGLGGALYYLNPGIEFPFRSAYLTLPEYGFNAIPVALLASCNPIAIIFSAIFIRYISTAGIYFPLAGFNRYFADLIVAIIIYIAAFTKFFSGLLNRLKKKKMADKEGKEALDDNELDQLMIPESKTGKDSSKKGTE